MAHVHAPACACASLILLRRQTNPDINLMTFRRHILARKGVMALRPCPARRPTILPSDPAEATAMINQPLHLSSTLCEIRCIWNLQPRTQYMVTPTCRLLDICCVRDVHSPHARSHERRPWPICKTASGFALASVVTCATIVLSKSRNP